MISLYRKGNSHIVRGVQCELGRFENSELKAMLELGWVADPKDIDKPNFEEVDTNDSGKLSNKEVRAAAEKAGLENWKTGRIDKLKAELGLDG